jgi:hypothetical protein
VHLLRIAVHDLKAGAYKRCKIDFVDDEKIRAGDARPAFARDLFSGRNIDHVDCDVSQFRTEGRREIVTTRLDQDHVEGWEGERARFVQQTAQTGHSGNAIGQALLTYS